MMEITSVVVLRLFYSPCNFVNIEFAYLDNDGKLSMSAQCEPNPPGAIVERPFSDAVSVRPKVKHRDLVASFNVGLTENS